MARIARVVIPGLPHLVTQRGNRHEQVFFEEGDYKLYLNLVFEAAEQADCQIWCYCLMPNHVHMIVVPGEKDGLRRTFADAHRRYTKFINDRLGVSGHLWQGRYGSAVLDEAHLLDAVRYVSLNPVRAGLVEQPQDWRWSSVKGHIARKGKGAFMEEPVLERVGPLKKFLAEPFDEQKAYGALRRGQTTGRPLGDAEWLGGLEDQTGRTLVPKKRGPKPKAQQAEASSGSFNLFWWL